MEKIKDVEVRHAIFDCLHILIFMPSTFGRPFESLKACGKKKVVERFDTFKLGYAWTKYFWAYYWAKLVHISIILNYYFFIFGIRCNTSCFSWGHLFQLKPSIYMHYQYPCKVMDSWPLSSATLKS